MYLIFPVIIIVIVTVIVLLQCLSCSFGQNPQSNSGSENENEETVPTVQPGNSKEDTADELERDYQNVMNKGKELTVLLNQIESATDKNANNNDLNGNLNPTPEVSEIPDEENSEEEHDAEQEKANQQAWENLSAAQKKYLETLEAGRTRRKLILRCMRHPGEVRIDPLQTEVPDLSIERLDQLQHPGEVRIDPMLTEYPDLRERLDQLQQECISDELVRECLSDNAVVRLD